MIKNFRYPALFVLLLSLAFTACKEPGDDDPQVVLPTNLTTTIDQTEDGVVTVTASADLANFYTITFFEGDDSTSIESTNGTESYTYTVSGTHSIRTRAHTSAADFIETSDEVTLDFGPGLNGQIPTTGYETPMSYPNYTLVWNDEFDGNTLSSDWVHELGNGTWGWGNNELQYYRAENTTVSDGYLVINVKEEPFNGYAYTSSRIKTQGIQSFQYGRIDIRAVLPYSQGMWPALWMLGESHSTVGWPACGEIDIMEMVGGTGMGNKTVYGTIHWDANGQNANYGGSRALNDGIFAEEFHVFSIEWDANEIRWYLDDVQYHTADITPADLSEFHEEFFFIFNVAVGGNWPGSPDASTVFPQFMAVDYVRVFQ